MNHKIGPRAVSRICDETLRGRACNVPAATGARHPVVLGAIAPRLLVNPPAQRRVSRRRDRLSSIAPRRSSCAVSPSCSSSRLAARAAAARRWRRSARRGRDLRRVIRPRVRRSASYRPDRSSRPPRGRVPALPGRCVCSRYRKARLPASARGRCRQTAGQGLPGGRRPESLRLAFRVRRKLRRRCRGALAAYRSGHRCRTRARRCWPAWTVGRFLGCAPDPGVSRRARRGTGGRRRPCSSTSPPCRLPSLMWCTRRK